MHLHLRGSLNGVYASVMMNIGQYTVLIIESNQNIMLAIFLYLLKAFPYNTSVWHTIPVYFLHQIMCHVIWCFSFLSHVRKQDATTTLLIVNSLLNCYKTKHCCFLTQVLYREIRMAVRISSAVRLCYTELISKNKQKKNRIQGVCPMFLHALNLFNKLISMVQ